MLKLLYEYIAGSIYHYEKCKHTSALCDSSGKCDALTLNKGASKIFELIVVSDRACSKNCKVHEYVLHYLAVR